MPNYVTNVITFQNKNDFEKIVKKYESKENLFDFNKVIPMPAELNLPEGSISEDAIKYYNKHKNDKTDEYKKVKTINPNILSNEESKILKQYNVSNLYDLGKLYEDNLKNYGARSWYDWCIQNWGTKWNAVDTTLDYDNKKIIFQTAWNIPQGILDELSKQNSAIPFEVDSQNEDFSLDGLHQEYENGEISDSYNIDDEEEQERIFYAFDESALDNEDEEEDER